METRIYDPSDPQKYGYVKYDEKTKEVLVTYPDEKRRMLTLNYLTSPFAFQVPEGEHMLSHSFAMFTPSDSLGNMEMALCELNSHTGLRVGHPKISRCDSEHKPMLQGYEEVVNIEDFRDRKYIDKMREFPEYYEYCLIDSYEEKYDKITANSIPIGGVNAQILELKHRMILVSIEFSKERFELWEACRWLEEFNVFLDEKNKEQYSISKCSKILGGLRFKDNPLVFFEKGNSNSSYSPDEFPEITDRFIVYEQEIDTKLSKKVSPQQTIFFNGKQIKDIPRINFNKNDLVLCNGNCLMVDYIDNFRGTIGFFRKHSTIPVAFVADKETRVYISLQSGAPCTCTVEFDYYLDYETIDDLEKDVLREYDPQKCIKKCINDFRRILKTRKIDYKEPEDEYRFVLDLKFKWENISLQGSVQVIIDIDEKYIELCLTDYMSMEDCRYKGKVMRVINEINSKCRTGVFFMDNGYNIKVKHVFNIVDNNFSSKDVLYLANNLLINAQKAREKFNKLLFR